MRRTLLALAALGMLFAVLAGTAPGCNTAEKSNFCEYYMRCVGYDPAQPGCRKNMDGCTTAYGAEEFSAACMTKAKATIEAGSKRPADYCSDLCAVCD